jgi:hypothetical protein
MSGNVWRLVRSPAHATTDARMQAVLPRIHPMRLSPSHYPRRRLRVNKELPGFDAGFAPPKCTDSVICLISQPETEMADV